MRRSIMILLAGAALCALASCQNLAGTPGNVPDNCAVPGSSCETPDRF
jgi:hypothetical protein